MKGIITLLLSKFHDALNYRRINVVEDFSSKFAHTEKDKDNNNLARFCLFFKCTLFSKTLLENFVFN